MKKMVLIASALFMWANFANAGLITVGEFNTNQCCGSPGNGVELTVANVGGDLVYTGKDSSASILDNDIIVAGTWSNMFTSWISSGGTLVAHDWSSIAAYLLPGMSGAVSVSYSSSDVNVIDPTHEIVSGPFGTIDDSIMDGGSGSVHRAWSLASLLSSSDSNVGAVEAFLSSGGDDHVTAFSYSYGLGQVIYAGMPLEAYTQTIPLNRPNVPGAVLYANNELAYAASFHSTVDVPEPGSLALLGLGLAGLGFSRKMKRAS